MVWVVAVGSLAAAAVIAACSLVDRHWITARGLTFAGLFLHGSRKRGPQPARRKVTLSGFGGRMRTFDEDAQVPRGYWEKNGSPHKLPGPASRVPTFPMTVFSAVGDSFRLWFVPVKEL